MKQPSESRPHLRLVTSTAPAQQAWFAQAERDALEHVTRHGHLLSDPSLAPWVVEQCAELIWESQRGAASWDALSIAEVWRRLANLHHFFPQPRLVIAHYETLRVFLPWLSTQGRLERGRCLAKLAELEQASASLLERAREQLAARAWPACATKRRE
jgi:hypothetical protein